MKPGKMPGKAAKFRKKLLKIPISPEIRAVKSNRYLFIVNAVYRTAFFFGKIFAMTFKNKKNPICAITWRDAAYSYEKILPQKMPPIKVACGFVVRATDQWINMATNVNYNPKTKKLWPVDGFVIPRKAIINFRKLKYFNG